MANVGDWGRAPQAVKHPIKSLAAGIRSGLTERHRTKVMQHMPPGANWRVYPAKVGRWRRVTTDSYSAFGITVIVFYVIGEVIGTLLGLTGEPPNAQNHPYGHRSHRDRLKKKQWIVDTQRVLLLDPQTMKPLPEHTLSEPYDAAPHPAQGTVPVQFLGDPRKEGLILPNGVRVEDALPTWRFTTEMGPKGSIGPWYADDQRQPQGRKYKPSRPA
jgi:hypothetical protein